MAKTITYTQLQTLGACENQLELFKQLFGDEVKLTLEVVKEHGHKFDIQWAANMLLSKEALAEYKRVRDAALAEYKRVEGAALAEYERVRDAALAEYKRVLDAALAEYEQVRDAALAEYEQVLDAALAEYKRVLDAALAEYEQKCAMAFYRLYK